MSHQSDAHNPNLKPANTENRYLVSTRDLPLSCPTPEMGLWNSHPRVYLAIETDGEAQCPYCGAEFELERAPVN